MAAVLQKDWPDRKVEILASTTVICILSTAILIWRVVYGVLNKRKLLLCDYLLIVAAVLNIVTTVIRFKTTAHGLGRHILDPSIIKPRDLLDYSYELFINQIINLIAVAILKYSICSYLLALKFSTVYVVIVWASIVMVTIFNLLLPMLGNFSCTPYEANWNKGLKNKDGQFKRRSEHIISSELFPTAGFCWYKAPLGLTYMQGVSNCVTDAVYVVAPIIYLRHIQLPRRTQWGLRVVFLLGIVATICSIFKTIELSALRKTRDPTWDGVNLTIWSATELSIGILIASLPPLRKQFDKMFRVILPSSFTTKNKTPGNSIPLYNVSKHHFSKPMGRSELDRDDGSSEHQILPADMDGKITKTVVHEITTMERETTNVMNGPVRTRESYGKMSG